MYLRKLGYKVGYTQNVIICEDSKTKCRFMMERGKDLPLSYYANVRIGLISYGYLSDPNDRAEFDRKFKSTRRRKQKEFNIITLCGSTKFKKEYIKCEKELTLKGNIVLTVGLFGHSGNGEVWMDNKKELMDRMHLRKIDMSDEIFVINKGGYIGESTYKEIEYATKKGKKITYLK